MNKKKKSINYYFCIFRNNEKGQLRAKCQLCPNNHLVTDLTPLIVRDSMIQYVSEV